MFGYTLHLLVILKGVMLDGVLAPAHVTDLHAGEELLVAHTDLVVIGDTGYLSTAVAATLAAPDRVHGLTSPRRNQKRQVPPDVAH